MAERAGDGSGDGVTGSRLSRRKIIAGAAAGILGAAVASEVDPGVAEAANGNALILGAANAEGKKTTLTNAGSGSTGAPALDVVSSIGDSSATIATWGAGVIGAAGVTGLTGVVGITSTNLASYAGVAGVTPLSAGALGAVGLGAIGGGLSTAAGVVGFVEGTGGLTVSGGLTAMSVGVLGAVGSAFPGEYLTSVVPAGVQGVASTSGDAGVEAINAQGGLALKVLGSASFSTSGSGTVAAQSLSVLISDPGVGAGSLVLLTFTADPGTSQAWVDLQPGVGFVVNLTKKSATALGFSYFRVN
ncbi:MAG: hypothetical protein ABSF84_14865 [Acidimicrobiales bacterium]|jgi:hypothetical protein